MCHRGRCAYDRSGHRDHVFEIMTPHDGRLDDAARTIVVPRGDPDRRKGAMEHGRPWLTTNAPGLDDDGMPNDETAIAQDALGAREDGSQG